MYEQSESRNNWLPMKIDDKKGTLEVLWNDIYDLNVKTGEWKPVKGKTYWAKDFKTTGDAWLQKAVSGSLYFFPQAFLERAGDADSTRVQNFAGSGVMATGIYGNESQAIFEIEGSGKEQWVSFYHQSESPSHPSHW